MRAAQRLKVILLTGGAVVWTFLSDVLTRILCEVTVLLFSGPSWKDMEVSVDLSDTRRPGEMGRPVEVSECRLPEFEVLAFPRLVTSSSDPALLRLKAITGE
mmetsp:Transcript_124948/g.233671  ORF Transcript_124948/g.233671 Transcript_124948/m.233671 type:complete len:102 (+) Transcript_124948:1300-1605(+)